MRDTGGDQVGFADVRRHHGSTSLADVRGYHGSTSLADVGGNQAGARLADVRGNQAGARLPDVGGDQASAGLTDLRCGQVSSSVLNTGGDQVGLADVRDHAIAEDVVGRQNRGCRPADYNRCSGRNLNSFLERIISLDLCSNTVAQGMVADNHVLVAGAEATAQRRSRSHRLRDNVVACTILQLVMIL